MLKLRFKNNSNNAVWLVEPKVSIGSGPDNDFVLPGASQHHADILVDHEQVQLQLKTPSSDTFINDKRIGEDKIYSVALNDVIRIGTQELLLVDPKKEPRAVKSKAASTEATGWALKSNSAALSNRVYKLTSSMVVGRSNDCDIALSTAHLSRRHASLSIKNGLLYVKDLGSSNGTYLNGEKIAESRVKRGDELCFDTLSFGVMGPSDELDKTTVRSVSQLTSKSTESAVKTDSSSRRASVNNVSSRESIKRKLEQQQAVIKRQAADGAVMNEQEKGKSWLVGVVLVVIIAVGGWAASQFL